MYAVLAQPANGFDRVRERARQLGDGVVHFRDVRVDTDLHRFHAQVLDAVRLLLPYQDAVGLELDAEGPFAGILQNLEEIPPHQDFAAADREEKTPASAIWSSRSLISAVVISPWSS